MSDRSKQTVIENGTEFDGTIVSECPITLSGTIKGQLDAPSLDVTPEGSVHGKVTVGELKSEGEVSGEIEAGSVELSGRVSDQTVIRAKTLQVKLSKDKGGVEVSFGNCELEVGDMPVKSKGKSKDKSQDMSQDMSQKSDAKTGEHFERDIAETVTDLMK